MLKTEERSDILRMSRLPVCGLSMVLFPGHKPISQGEDTRGPDLRQRIGFRWWNISGVLMGSGSLKDTGSLPAKSIRWTDGVRQGDSGVIRSKRATVVSWSWHLLTLLKASKALSFFKRITA